MVAKLHRLDNIAYAAPTQELGKRIAVAKHWMRVRLTRKLAERLDGIDLSEHKVGDLLDLSLPQARLILAEEWAMAERRYHVVGTHEHRRSDDRLPTTKR